MRRQAVQTTIETDNSTGKGSRPLRMGFLPDTAARTEHKQRRCRTPGHTPMFQVPDQSFRFRLYKSDFGQERLLPGLMQIPPQRFAQFSFITPIAFNNSLIASGETARYGFARFGNIPGAPVQSALSYLVVTPLPFQLYLDLHAIKFMIESRKNRAIRYLCTFFVSIV